MLPGWECSEGTRPGESLNAKTSWLFLFMSLDKCLPLAFQVTLSLIFCGASILLAFLLSGVLSWTLSLLYNTYEKLREDRHFAQLWCKQAL